MVLIFLVVSLYKEIVGPAMTFIIAAIVLGVTQVLSPAEILGGFANEQVAVILLLLLLGEIFRKTSVLDIFFDKIFQSAKSERGFTTRMMFVVAPLSAFLNNTPLVAILMPYVHNWSTRNKVAVSKLMMPLSFATILGGCATLIGTSTNLVVNGLVTDGKIIPNLPSLGIFDFSAVGIPMIIIGSIYIIFIGQKMIPEKQGVTKQINEINRKYIVEARIKKGSNLIGKTISESGINKETGLYLFEILRDDIRITAVPDDTIFMEEDILLFLGNTDSIANFLDSKNGMIIPSVGMFARKKNTDVLEIVISHNSMLINRTLKSVNFRAKYDATVIAVHRNGETFSGQISDIEIKPGDALLLLTGSYFEERIKNTNDFYLISKIREIRRLGVARTTYLVAGSLAVIVFSAFGIIKLFTGLLFLITTLVLLKITRPKDLVNSIDYELALIIALSLALGIAMMKSGVASMFAEGIITVFRPLGKVGVLAGIYFITTILAAFITNKAAVAVIFPVSLNLALELNTDPMPFILVVAFAAAANFMTPIGYQTNLMVYGPGGYKFKDFLRVGTPLTVMYMIVSIIILSLIYF